MPHVNNDRSTARRERSSSSKTNNNPLQKQQSLRTTTARKRSITESSSTTAAATNTTTASSSAERAILPEPVVSSTRILPKRSRTTVAGTAIDNTTSKKQVPKPKYPAKQQQRSPLQEGSEAASSSSTTNVPGGGTVYLESFGTGCLICRKEDDEDRILLCEGCEGEYHTYCLQPPLDEIPEDDWYCDNCLADPDDSIEKLVAALPPSFTSRFGEVVFAQGGAGYGWWPSLIFDPRLTIEPARSQARKYLGSRHLVYFFQCADSPFSVLPMKQIKSWIEGLSEDLHLGRAARNHGKQRWKDFREALEVACLEMEKLPDDRLDWEHPDPTEPSSPPQQSSQLLSSPTSAAAQVKRSLTAESKPSLHKTHGTTSIMKPTRKKLQKPVRPSAASFRSMNVLDSKQKAIESGGWTIRRKS